MRRVAGLLLAVLAPASCAPPPPDPAVEEPPVNTLKWTARAEEGVYGYLVYRAERREGPFRRISDPTVRVPADGAPTHAYSFTDPDVEPGRTYYYYLDVVSEAGIKQRFSGIIEKVTSPSRSSPRPAPS